MLAVSAWYLGACGGGTTSGKDAAVADTVQADTTPTDTTELDTTTPVDTAQPDTTEPDTAETDTVEVDTVETDTATDTVETDTVATDTLTTDVLDDTTVADTSTPPDTTTTTGFVITKHDNCTEAGVAVGTGVLPFSDSDDTSDYTNLYSYSLDAPCQAIPADSTLTWGAGSPDVVYTLTPDVSGSYALLLAPVGFDPGMMVTTACGNLDSCVVTSDQVGSGAQELINIELTAGTTYYVYVMGYGNTTAEQGAYSFSVSMGEICDNNQDDNNDNAADCEDPLCADAPNCDESNTDVYGDGSCVDGTDNDGDGATDCADADCEFDAACDEGDTTLYPNGCSDAPVDNDGDGLIDCADPDCSNAANCDEGNDTLYPNGCANVDGSSNPIDDDGDGLANCADPDCAAAPNCDEGDTDTYPGGCTDSADNDGDGLTDCEDDDCALNLGCLGQGDTCADPFALEVGVPATYNTVDFSPVYGIKSGDCPGDTFGAVGGGYGTGSKDVVFSFTPTTSGKFHFSLTEDQENEGTGTGNFDNGIYITTDCEAIADSCIAAWETEIPPTPEEFTVPLEAGVTYFVIVDGWSSTTGSQEGQFTLTLTEADNTLELICGDTVDDDTDGDTDCDDVDCFFDSDCIPELCTDGIDNDHDGLTDCEDDEVDPATSLPRCPAHLCIDEVCDSGLDDDGDGLTDCEDDECLLFVSSNPGDTCAANGDVCALPFLVDLDPGTGAFTDTRNLCDFHNGVVFSSTSPSTCKTTSSSSGDIVYAYTTGAAPENITVKATPTQSFNLVLNVTAVDAACDAPITTCVAAADATTSSPEQVSFAGTPNTTYLFMVDLSSSTGACGSTAREVTFDVKVSPSELGACDNATDDDGDGLTDCFDPDCGGDTACPTLGGSTCDAPIEVYDEIAFTTNTCNYTGDFNSLGQGGCENTTSTTATGKDFVVRFIAPHVGPYEVHLDATFDSVFNVVKADTCPTSPLDSCVGGFDDPDVGGVIPFNASAVGDRFFIVVDAYSSACGAANFEIVALEAEVTDGPTACVDGNDNDGNGLTDCFDASCRDDAACGGTLLGGNCDAPIVMTDVGSFTTNSCNYGNNFASAEVENCQSTSSSGNAGDILVEFIAPSAGPYVAKRTTPFDSVFNVVASSDVGDACPLSPINMCVGGVDTPDANGLIPFTAAAPGDIFYVILDGWSSSCGKTDFEIAMAEPETGACSDDIDNDFDGKTDCVDTDCADDVACDESLYTDGCTNDIDDDGDGKTDCLDTDCAADVACDESLYTEGCGNDIDDDGDGKTDCADPDCVAAPACDEAQYTDGCTNTVDDDGDSKTDCADWNCKVGEIATCGTLPGDVCDMPDGSNLMIQALPYQDSSLTTCDFGSDHPIGSSNGCSYHGTTPEVVYEYIAPSDQTVKITLTSSDGTDTVLNVSDLCAGNSSLPSCLASDDVYYDDILGDTGESVEIELLTGTHIYIYASAYSSTDCTPFEMLVEDVTP